MAPVLINRVAQAARRLNPFTLSRAIGRVDELTLATRELTRSIEALRTRTEQLLTIEETNSELQQAVAELPASLDTERVRNHVTRAIKSATLELDPFPHLLVDRWLPTDVYKLMIGGLPPPIFFAARDVSRQRSSSIGRASSR